MDDNDERLRASDSEGDLSYHPSDDNENQDDDDDDEVGEEEELGEEEEVGEEEEENDDENGGEEDSIINGKEFVNDTIEDDEVPENGYNIESNHDHCYSKRRSSQDILSIWKQSPCNSKEWDEYAEKFAEALKYEQEQGNLRNLSINAPI